MDPSGGGGASIIGPSWIGFFLAGFFLSGFLDFAISTGAAARRGDVCVRPTAANRSRLKQLQAARPSSNNDDRIAAHDNSETLPKKGVEDEELLRLCFYSS